MIGIYGIIEVEFELYVLTFGICKIYVRILEGIVNTKVKASFTDIQDFRRLYKKTNRRNTDYKRRVEICNIGCELRCLYKDDIRFILNSDNDIESVERLFTKRKME